MDTLGTVPVHLRIADALRRRIDDGALQPGDALPPVRELAEHWSCTAGTAREALNVLRGEGRITTGRGKPATVRKPPHRIRLTPGLGQLQKTLVRESEEARRSTGAIEMTAGISIEQTEFRCDYEIVPADRQLAQEFDIPLGSELLRRRYEMIDRESGHRISYSRSYIPKFLIEGNPDLFDSGNEPWPGGHQHQLYTVGIEIDHFARTVTAFQPTPGDQQRWGMDSGIPMLLGRARSVDIQHRAVEISEAYYPADRTEIEFREQLQRW